MERKNYVLIRLDIKLIELIELISSNYGYTHYTKNIIFQYLMAYFNYKDDLIFSSNETLLIIKMCEFLHIYDLLNNTNILVSVIKIYDYNKYIKYRYDVFENTFFNAFKTNYIYFKEKETNINHDIKDEIINSFIKFKYDTKKKDCTLCKLFCYVEYEYIYNGTNKKINFYFMITTK
jgi:hypothetical protein